MTLNAKAVALAVLATLAVGASPAAAATTVGSLSLSSAGSNPIMCTSSPCVVVLDKLDGADVFTPTGVITSWSVRRASGTVALRVLRGRPGESMPNELHATNVDESLDRTGSGSDTAQSFDTRLPVKAEDYIGITLVAGSSIGNFSGPGDQIFEVAGDPNLANVDNTTPENFEPLLSATVEPDADGDGFGDESEDACPSSAATQGACPVAGVPKGGGGVKPPVSTAATTKVRLGSRSATFRGGKASITLKNPNAVAVKGKLSLKLRKKAVGSRSYSLAAGATAKIRVKLAKVARRRIAKRGKVKLSLRITAKGATGATFKTAAKLTVKKAARRRRRKGGSALDGKYGRDPSSGPNLRFTVTGGGRKIVTLTGSVGGFCSVLVPFGGGIRSEFRPLFAGIDSIEVAADGSFAGSQKLSDTTTEITNGKLAGGVATGTVRVTSPGCTSGKANFKSRRTGP